jgi:arginine decarboxylase
MSTFGSLTARARACSRPLQVLAAEAFGAGRTWFLVNGTTVGVHACVLAACAPGDAVVLSRNCHVSALSACALAGAVPFFADAEGDAAFGVAHGVTPASACAALDAAAVACAAAAPAVTTRGGRAPRVALLMVVSPTYFGAAADVAGLAAVAHARGVPLAVDEAHGAHFACAHAAAAAAAAAGGYALPPSALSQGADAAVQSTHKTLPALTQASMLHAAHGGALDGARISAALAALQSSSPSYLLLASLDAARADAAAGDGVSRALRAAAAARAALAASAPALRLLGPGDVGRPGIAALDITRLTVCTASVGVSGYDAAQALSVAGVTPELVAPRCVVFVIGGGTSERDVARLVDALARLAPAHGVNEAAALPRLPPLPPPPPLALPPRRALFAARRERVPRAAAEGRISADTLCPYPPVRCTQNTNTSLPRPC